MSRIHLAAAETVLQWEFEVHTRRKARQDWDLTMTGMPSSKGCHRAQGPVVLAQAGPGKLLVHMVQILTFFFL